MLHVGSQQDDLGEGCHTLFAAHPTSRNSKYHKHDVFKQGLQKGSLFDPPLLSLSLISPIKIVCATNPSCIAGTFLASKYNPNVNSLELGAACQERNNLSKAKQSFLAGWGGVQVGGGWAQKQASPTRRTSKLLLSQDSVTWDLFSPPTNSVTC